MNIQTIKHVYFKLIPNILILCGILVLMGAYGPVIYDEVWYRVKVAKDQEYSLQQGQEDSVFARFLTSSPVLLEPVNTDFSVVIEKIGVNAPVNRDVSVINEEAYLDSLHTGVAHAITSPYPSSDPGNVYLFAHSSINFWRLGRYAKVFNLLRKLELGDTIHVFYEGENYVYEVVNKEVHPEWNTNPLTRPVLEPTLTLQTCDPPGTTLNRLVVTARLKEIRPYTQTN